MASKFQSRLVGTILLVSVGVIVLPDLLDGKKQHYKEELAPIPIKPELEGEMEVFEVLEPVEDDLVLPDSPVSVTVASTESEPEEIEVTPRPVAEKNDYADSAWIIQLMALKNVENAKKAGQRPSETRLSGSYQARKRIFTSYHWTGCF
ncbi:DedD protein [Vibrio nigripulchritudo ATCC 27043]|uniref:hypothetical protein n=1 Tax=Vibrio nigripulchritudo TaxID=28173 RepID=UPI00021C3850|nr:DedD protein [Vibrio nigripulchritudo ATCC 27043]